MRFPRERHSWDDFAKRRGLQVTLNRFSWANAPGAYLIKPQLDSGSLAGLSAVTQWTATHGL